MNNEPDDQLRITTRVAVAQWGDNRFCGRSVNDDLAGTANVWQILALAVGHPHMPLEDTPILEDMVVCCVAADPRIWPLKTTRLLSAYGHATAGTIAGMYCTEDSPFGWRSCFIAARFLQELIELPPQALSEAIRTRLEQGERLPGYGVAFRKQDERVTALARCVEQRGLSQTPHWQLARQIAQVEGAPAMNIGSACAAVLLDRGFTPTQIHALGPYIAFPNYLANALEGAQQAPAALQRLPEHSIDDRCTPPRQSPRALGRRD